MAQQELFRLGASTPERAFAHGHALAYATAEAAAEFRRGANVSLGFDLQGRVGGGLGDRLAAAINAAAAVEIGIAVQAYAPIDLFLW